MLAYAARGNLQSVLDEYVHMLAEWRGYRDGSSVLDVAADMGKALTLRSAVYTIRANGTSDGVFAERSMRGRYAVRFGDQKSEEGSEDRVEAVALAFNSPFWPYVLTSTSIGQEGQDFHL